MEIKRVDNETINEYPKMNEFNKKDLKKCIPKKWSKLGLSSFIFGILMRTRNSNALSEIDFTEFTGRCPSISQS